MDAIKSVRDLLQVNLLEVIEGKLIEAMFEQAGHDSAVKDVYAAEISHFASTNSGFWASAECSASGGYAHSAT
jgi:hypothetical protein